MKYEKKLVIRFYLAFWIGIVICTIIISGFTAGTIISWIKYNQGENKLFIPILATALLLMFIVLSIVWLKPSVRDLPAVRKRKFERTTGSIVRYKTVIHGGESPTRSYHPIVRDNITGKEVGLIIINRDEKDFENPITKNGKLGQSFMVHITLFTLNIQNLLL